MNTRFLLAVMGQAFWLAIFATIFVVYQFAFVDWPLDRALGVLQ